VTLEERRRARDVLDAQEGTGPVHLASPDEVVRLLREARRGAPRIAVVGASERPWRPSHSVMATLLERGYDCVPVNPNAESVLGLRCYPTLEAAVAETGPVDLVDVFRRSEHAPGVARSAVAVGARVLWLQLAVVSWEAARIAAEGGLAVVMDRCTAIELPRVTGRG
jgi:predicted CoA-binding protein